MLVTSSGKIYFGYRIDGSCAGQDPVVAFREQDSNIVNSIKSRESLD
jgi:hypothetical protein